MKIRRVLLSITLFLVIICVVTFRYISHTEINNVDIVAINNVVKTVEEEFAIEKLDINRISTINRMNYRVVLTEDVDYNSQMNRAVKSQCTIMDFSYKNKMVGKIIVTGDDSAQKQMKDRLIVIIFLIVGIVWLMSCAVIIMIYYQIVRPFKKMQQFARRVAEGDLDFSLEIQKNNYFGAFTESFDLMREELKKARLGEYEANLSKKELVAELSHDIKTPVATIKAVCELMEAKWNSYEDSQKKNIKNDIEVTGLLDYSKEKVDVIYNKADMIDKLISNMFHATLEELEMLKIEAIEVESNVIEKMFQEINHYEKIHFINNVPECLIKCDTLRLSQVIDNVINNSYKYADTNIDVRFDIDRKDKSFIIKIKDYGDGVEESQLPLVCQKYYRGSSKKVRSVPGSGLGLYLAKLFMEGMQGTFECYNENGFVVEISVLMA
jgi:signal transduction histidine kinase